MRLHTRSRKYRSWVTMMSPPVKLCKNPSSQRIISLSRWLVGSSRIITSAGWRRTVARATRFRWPPERVPTVWSKSVIPSRVSMALASYSISSRTSGEYPAKTCSRTVLPSSMSGFWLRKLTWTLGSRDTAPSSGTCFPASTRSRELFPVPLMPMMPILSPLVDVQGHVVQKLLEPEIQRDVFRGQEHGGSSFSPAV